jgi:formylmethanofuran dehydrogenase subunit A
VRGGDRRGRLRPAFDVLGQRQNLAESTALRASTVDRRRGASTVAGGLNECHDMASCRINRGRVVEPTRAYLNKFSRINGKCGDVSAAMVTPT